MTSRNLAPTPKVDELYDLIEDIDVAMLTTRRRDGSLISRPMETQRRMDGAHFWFVAAEGHPKLDEIAGDPNVNLAYYKDSTKEWVSVAGVARIVRDRSRIRELYEPTWRMWFPDEGPPRDGGPEDPRIVLIAVEARSAQYMALRRTAPVVLFESLKDWIEGEKPRPRRVKKVAGAEFD